MDGELLPDEAAEGLHVTCAAAGMGCDQIIGEKLILARLGAEAAKQVAENEECFPVRFPHQLQDVLFGVLGSDLHLSGDVVANDLAEVTAPMPPVGQDQVGADSGGYDGLLDAGDQPEFLEQGTLAAVVGPEVFADGGV